jgi:hypothetical protein
MLLGDVGEVQEVRERAGHRQRFADGHPLEDAAQRLEVLAAAGARALGQGPDALHRVVQLVPLLPPERLAQQLAQQAHIVSKRLGELVAHETSLSRGHRAA